jgi:hypothetical protein
MKRFTDIKKPLKRIFEQTEVPVRSEDPNFSQMPKLEEEKSVPAKFFSKIFESREMAHMFHLKTQGEGSFSQHLALQDYYEGDNSILGLIDDLIEVYQGQYDLVEGWDNIDKQSKISEDPLQYFIEVAEFVKRTRYSAISEEDAHLQAIIDEILNTIYKLIYKLRFLK